MKCAFISRRKIPEEERAAALARTQELVLEIKSHSRLGAEEISKAFIGADPARVVVSGDMLRQYLCGQKVASPRKRVALARAAFDKGWAGKHCRKSLAEACLNDIEPVLKEILIECKYDVEAAQALVSKQIHSVAARLQRATK